MIRRAFLRAAAATALSFTSLFFDSQNTTLPVGSRSRGEAGYPTGVYGDMPVSKWSPGPVGQCTGAGTPMLELANGARAVARPRYFCSSTTRPRLWRRRPYLTCAEHGAPPFSSTNYCPPDGFPRLPRFRGGRVTRFLFEAPRPLSVTIDRSNAAAGTAGRFVATTTAMDARSGACAGWPFQTVEDTSDVLDAPARAGGDRRDCRCGDGVPDSQRLEPRDGGLARKRVRGLRLGYLRRNQLNHYSLAAAFRTRPDLPTYPTYDHSTQPNLPKRYGGDSASSHFHTL